MIDPLCVTDDPKTEEETLMTLPEALTQIGIAPLGVLLKGSKAAGRVSVL
jgi:hypothetical protein